MKNFYKPIFIGFFVGFFGLRLLDWCEKEFFNGVKFSLIETTIIGFIAGLIIHLLLKLINYLKVK